LAEAHPQPQNGNTAGNSSPLRESEGSAGKATYAIYNNQLQQNLEEGFHLYEPTYPIYDVVPYRDQQLVAGEEGLLIFEEGKFRSYHVAGISFPAPISKLAIKDEKLALLSNGTLSVYDMQEQLLTTINAPVDHFIWDKWSTLWYSKGRALLFDVGHVNEEPPVLTIGSILGENETEINTPFSLEEGSSIDIVFDCVYPPLLDTPELVYRLRSNEDWRPVTTQNRLKLRDLKSGSYEIQLKAKGLNEATSFSKTIKARVGNNLLAKVWPWVLGVMLGLLSLSIFSQFRLRSQLKELSEQKQKIKLAAELNEKQQKIGQLQMNPHFLFNTLNSISGLIALNENKKARKYLNEFSQMMRKLLSGSRNDFLSISDESEFLKKYMSLEAMCRNDCFDYEVTLDDGVEPQSLIPSMILQPIVENAIIHGLSHKKERGKVSVHFSKEGNQVQVVIEDNGIGREAAKEFASESHESTAMAVIEERLATLDKWNKSEVIYEDLRDAGGAALGTRVRLRLPLRSG